MLGLLYGYGAKPVQTRSRLQTRAYISGLLMTAAFSFLAWYSYKISPDWMFMYFVDYRQVPSWLVGYIMVLYVGAYTAGFLLAPQLQRPGRAMLLCIAAEAIIIFLVRDRYVLVTSYEGFWQNMGGDPLPESVVGRVPGMCAVFLVPLGVYLYFWSKRQADSSA